MSGRAVCRLVLKAEPQRRGVDKSLCSVSRMEGIDTGCAEHGNGLRRKV